jgi:hypothetical protein
VLIADLRAERQGDFYAEFEAAAVSGFRQHLVDSLEIAASSAMTLDGTGAARLVVFRNAIANEPVALIVGAPDLSRPVLVRLHSECLTGDVFGSRRCDCGDQLRLAFSRIQSALVIRITVPPPVRNGASASAACVKTAMPLCTTPQMSQSKTS